MITTSLTGGSEWGTEVALVQARPGGSLLADWSWWWATVGLSGLIARHGNSGQVEDGRDLRLLWCGLQDPQALRRPWFTTQSAGR